MGMGKRKRSKQDSLFIPTASLARSSSHDFYERLNQVLSADGFDDFVEDLCEPFYVQGEGRPRIPPGTYFRMLLVGFFEGLDSERGIDWRVSDSMALRPFLGYDLTESTPDHSTLSRIRQRLPVEVHDEVFTWILTVLAKADLLKGKTVAVDATTLEANAALRSLQRRDTGEAYQEYLTTLAKASGLETPSRADLAKLDKKRPKKVSNDDWEHPHDPDAKVTKMKDRRTHLAHKAEHTVDLETQAIVAVSLADANEGDTSSLPWSLLRAETNLSAVATDPRRLLIHVGAFNLSLLMRQLLGAGTPRGFAALVRTLESIVAAFETGGCAIIALWRPSNTLSTPNASIISIRRITFIPPSIRRRSTGC